jgi:hypothetical protein
LDVVCKGGSVRATALSGAATAVSLRNSLPGAYSRAQSALGDSMTIYEMALSRIVAGFVVAIGRLIEMVFELVI